jgi:hypothetical protein
VLKKSGIILVALILSTFTLASYASAETPQAPTTVSMQAIQPAAPAPAFQLAPAVQTPAAAPANISSGLEWLAISGPGKPVCRCSRDSQCGTGGACCWWPKQTCGICC